MARDREADREAGRKARIEADDKLRALELEHSRRERDPYADGVPIRYTAAEVTEWPSPVAMAVLALVATLGRAHAYQVVSEVRRRGGVQGASERTIYRALGWLSEKDFLSALNAVKDEKRDLTVYVRTPKGEQALRVWAGAAMSDAPELPEAEIVSKARAAAFDTTESARVNMKFHLEELADRLDDLGYEERSRRRDGELDELLELEYRLRTDLLRAHIEFARRAMEHFTVHDPADEEFVARLKRQRQSR